MFFISTAYAEEVLATNTEVSVPSNGHKAVFPPFDTTHFASQMLWLALSFGLFYLFISRVISPKLSSILSDRAHQIKGDLDEASKLKDASDIIFREYEKSLSTARQDALKMASEAQEKAKARAQEEAARAEAELEEKLRIEESVIAKKRDAALDKVEAVAQEITSKILTQLTGEEFDENQIATAVKAIKA